METTQPYKMGVREAKRWLKDSMGYAVLRSLIRDGELTNKHWNSEFKVSPGEWKCVTFVPVGNSTLVLNHTNHCLEWQQ